ncbi:MAG TPA: LysM peptidoglycan-binding domain-containing protein [Bacillaceae bacterium]
MSSIWRKYSYAILFICVTMMMGIYLIFSLSEESGSHTTIIVKDGDSLWTISERHAGDFGMSVPEFIQILEKENRVIGKTIMAGEELVVPSAIKRISDRESELAYETD